MESIAFRILNPDAPFRILAVEDSHGIVYLSSLSCVDPVTRTNSDYLDSEFRFSNLYKFYQNYVLKNFTQNATQISSISDNKNLPSSFPDGFHTVDVVEVESSELIEKGFKARNKIKKKTRIILDSTCALRPLLDPITTPARVGIMVS